MCFGSSNKFRKVAVQVGDEILVEILTEKMCYRSSAWRSGARDMVPTSTMCAPNNTTVVANSLL